MSHFAKQTFLVEKRGSETTVCTVVYHGQRCKGFFKVLCIYTILYSLLLLVSRHEQQGKETPTCHILVHLNCNFKCIKCIARTFPNWGCSMTSTSKIYWASLKIYWASLKIYWASLKIFWASLHKDLLSQSKAFS